jgi:hypothetical protein
MCLIDSPAKMEAVASASAYHGIELEYPTSRAMNEAVNGIIAMAVNNSALHS